MRPGETEVLLTVADESLRQRILAELREAGHVASVLGLGELRGRRLQDNSFVIVETGEDVATLVQVVNDLYDVNDTRGQSLPLVALVPGRIIAANLGLAFWLVNDHVAVLSVLDSKDLDVGQLVTFISRLEPPPAGPSGT